MWYEKLGSQPIIFIYLYFLDCSYVDHYLKSSLNLLQYCFCYTLSFLGHKVWGILIPWPGIEPAHPPSLEGEVLTTGPPGKSLNQILLFLAFREVILTPFKGTPHNLLLK